MLLFTSWTYTSKSHTSQDYRFLKKQSPSCWQAMYLYHRPLWCNTLPQQTSHRPFCRYHQRHVQRQQEEGCTLFIQSSRNISDICSNIESTQGRDSTTASPTFNQFLIHVTTSHGKGSTTIDFTCHAQRKNLWHENGLKDTNWRKATKNSKIQFNGSTPSIVIALLSIQNLHCYSQSFAKSTRICWSTSHQMLLDFDRWEGLLLEARLRLVLGHLLVSFLVWPRLLAECTCYRSVGAVGMEKDCCASSTLNSKT